MAIPAHCPIHHPAAVNLVDAFASDSHVGILAHGSSSGSTIDVAKISARVRDFAIPVIGISVKAYLIVSLFRRKASCGVISSWLNTTIIAMPLTQE